MSDIKIKVKTLRGGQKDFELTVSTSITIPELKAKLEEVTSVPPSQQRLIYLGKVLKDEDKLSDYRTQFLLASIFSRICNLLFLSF